VSAALGQAQVARRPVRRKIAGEDWAAIVAVGALAVYLIVTVALPLWALLSKSFQNRDGAFVGLANFAAYFQNPTLSQSIFNSIWVAAATTAIVVPLAFAYAYALTRSCIPLKGLFRSLALIPILAPSLLPAISFVYLFGNQGIAKGLLGGQSIYGPIGIVMAEVFYCFPHALMILVTALAIADQRLYEAADSLGASRRRIFFTVTLPGAKYGLINAAFVVFTLVVTDFGIPKVIGGRFNVLATDIYKQVIGQQQFEMGAVVGLILLAPAVLAFAVERLIQRKQVALLSARAVPYQPKAAPLFDAAMFAYCLLVAGLLSTVLLVAAWGSFIKFWPYNLSLTFNNYVFENFDSAGWTSYWNSIEMSFWTSVVGTSVIFAGAYLIEKTKVFDTLKTLTQLIATLPLAVPGLVLGLGYIFFFNHPSNPFGFLYATMAILVLNTVAHFYTVAHLTATTALKQMDAEFEAVSASLKVPFWTTFVRVTVPVCVPAILDIGIYMFVNAMTTVSSVIFLYSTDTKLASVAVVNMEDAGMTAAAAAMAMMIVYTSALARVVNLVIGQLLLRRTQAWRKR
jgi:iron(III) transport system permease protein